jgi:predicted N-acyltransferase
LIQFSSVKRRKRKKIIAQFFFARLHILSKKYISWKHLIYLRFVSTSQAIEAAIELNLKTVEAGAQGEHKIERGYLPVTTYSCHYLIDEEFRKAIEDFLVRESSQV